MIRVSIVLSCVLHSSRTKNPMCNSGAECRIAVPSCGQIAVVLLIAFILFLSLINNIVKNKIMYKQMHIQPANGFLGLNTCILPSHHHHSISINTLYIE